MATTWWQQQKELEELGNQLVAETERAERWKRNAELWRHFAGLRGSAARLWRREAERLANALHR